MRKTEMELEQCFEYWWFEYGGNGNLTTFAEAELLVKNKFLRPTSKGMFDYNRACFWLVNIPQPGFDTVSFASVQNRLARA